MSYTTNTPFSLVTIDSETGKPLSEEALENRKRLILLWRLQKQELDAMESDLKDPETQCEGALTGETYIELLRGMVNYRKSAIVHPILKMDRLEAFTAESEAINGISPTSPLN